MYIYTARMCSMYLTFYIALNHKIGFALNIFVLVSSSFFFIETTISTLLPHLVIICVALVAYKEKVAWDPSIWLLWFFLLLDIKYWAHPSLSNEGRPFFHHTLSDLNVTHLYFNFIIIGWLLYILYVDIEFVTILLDIQYMYIQHLSPNQQETQNHFSAVL